MSLYNENQRNQKLTALKYLDKYNRKITRLDNKRGILDNYSALEKALKEASSKELKDMIKKEIEKKKSQGMDESPQIEVILNQETDFVLPVAKSNLRDMGSFAYTLYSYFQASNKEESKFGHYIIVKASGKYASNLIKNISKVPSLKNVTVAEGFSFGYSGCPKKSRAKIKTTRNDLAKLSEKNKQMIFKLRAKGETDSYKIKEKLGLMCGIMQIAGVIAAYARKNEV